MPSMIFRKLIQTLRADLHPHSERGKLIRAAAGTAALKVGTVLIAFLASLLYARVLGPHDFGLYVYVLAWVSVLTIPAGLGVTQYLVREGARFPATIGWLLRWGDKRVLIAGSIAATLLSIGFLIPEAAGARWMFLLAAPMPLLINMSSVRQALLQARGRIVGSQWAPSIVAPMFILIILLTVWLCHGSLSAVGLMATTTASCLIPFIVNTVQLRRSEPSSGTTSQGNTRASLLAALPFMWLDAAYLINSRIDLILLGTLKGAHDAGVYAIAVRAGELVFFMATVANIAIAPKISQLYQTQQYEKMQSLTTSVARRVLLLTVAIGLFLILLASPLLNFFYGTEYVAGASALIILAAAQLITTIVGPVSVLLDMTNHANLSAKAFGICAVLNFALNILLVPSYGMVGSALATAISLVTCSLIRWRMVRQHLNLRPSALGI